MDSLPLWAYYILGFPLLLGPLITLHELGHYLVGRWFGVGAEAFSIGFGKELVGWTDSRGTRWKLSAIPLGGYVQFKGDMNPASVPTADPQPATFGMATEPPPADSEAVGKAFNTAPLGHRALIVFAGPAANLLITLGIFLSFFMIIGRPVAINQDEQLTIASFSEQSAAPAAGLQVGDRLTAVDGVELESFHDLTRAVYLYPNRDLDITFERGSSTYTRTVRTYSEEMEDRFGNVSRIGLLGIAPLAQEARYDQERLGPVAATGMAFFATYNTLDMMLTGIAQIFTGERSVRELGGPIRIGKFAGEQLSAGLTVFVQFAALISLNLAFINLLPIPALDGGHLAFYAAEAVRRKPVGARGQEWAFRAGMALVLMLMLFVTVNDLVSLPFFRS